MWLGVGRFCHGDTGVSRLLGTARVDGSLHDVIRSVSACSNSLIRGHTGCHGSSCGQMGSTPNSRVVRGPGLRGGTKGQVRQSAGEKLAFAQQQSGRVHVGRGPVVTKTLNLRISHEKEIMARCAVSGFSARTPFVTPVLPGPASDIRMKKGWKVQSETRKSGVWFSRICRVLVGEWRYCQCLWVRLIEYGRHRTTQRGRVHVVPHAPVRMRTGGAQLLGRILESGVGHC